MKLSRSRASSGSKRSQRNKIRSASVTLDTKRRVRVWPVQGEGRTLALDRVESTCLSRLLPTPTLTPQHPTPNVASEEK